MLRGAVEQSRPLPDARRHRLAPRLDDLDMKVRGDLARMVQIFANLLNNAAKYTHEGGHIELHARREGNKATWQQGNKATRQQGNKATRQQGKCHGAR